jgi:hypothetical protein
MSLRPASSWSAQCASGNPNFHHRGHFAQEQGAPEIAAIISKYVSLYAMKLPARDIAVPSENSIFKPNHALKVRLGFR